MKYKVTKDELLTALLKIQNASPSKAAIPLLSNVLIEAVDNELILTCTDLTMSVRCFVPAVVKESGGTTLPIRRLIHLLKELTNPEVDISVKDNVSTIKSGSSRFKVNGMAKDEFPSFPDTDTVQELSFNQKELKKALQSASFAVSRDEPDPWFALTGVLLDVQGETVYFVGTDGKRLAKIAQPSGCNAKVKQKVILPIKSVEEIIRLLGDDDSATLLISSDRVALDTHSTRFVSKVLGGEYPDYEQILPEKSKYEIKVHKEEISSLLRQIALFTNENNQSVKFSFEKNTLTLAAVSADIGEGTVSMPVNYSHEKFNIAFNPWYLLDIIRHVTQETITIRLNDTLNPGVIDDQGTSIYLLMPMRLNEEVTAS